METYTVIDDQDMIFTVVVTETGSVEDIRTKFETMMEAIEYVHYILPSEDIEMVTIEEAGHDILYYDANGECTPA